MSDVPALSRPVDISRIAAAGTVAGSIICGENGCTFHRHVRLEGWSPPAKP